MSLIKVKTAIHKPPLATIRPLELAIKGQPSSEIKLPCILSLSNKIGSLDNVFLAYHIYTLDYEMVIFDGIRTALDCKSVKNISKCSLNLLLPPSSGEYLIQATLVKEGYYWFENDKATTWFIPLTVVDDQLSLDRYTAAIKSRILLSH